MGTPTYAVWGALLGWALMPRLKDNNGAPSFKPIIAYFLALVIVVAGAVIFEFRQQVWAFIVGMALQFGAFGTYDLLRHVRGGKTSRK